MADAVKTAIAHPAGPVEAVKMKLEGEASEACVQATPLTVTLVICTVYWPQRLVFDPSLEDIKYSPVAATMLPASVKNPGLEPVKVGPAAKAQPELGYPQAGVCSVVS